MGPEKGRVIGNIYKGPPVEDNREGSIECGRWGWIGWERIKGEMGTTVIA